MDATALRWVLAVLGIVAIVGVYLFSVYQSRQRRSAAVRTFTRDELDSEVIADEEFRDELAHINTMLEQEVSSDDLGGIRINPALDADTPPTSNQQPVKIQLPQAIFEVSVDHRIVHVLKAVDNRLYTGDEISEALDHAALALSDANSITLAVDEGSEFRVQALSVDGSLQALDKPDFSIHGLVCWFDQTQVASAAPCYELMLKKIDELVRVTDMKVYDERLQLLTLRQVTEIRNRLMGNPA
jgi:FtsZ-interacting cell division protein ZipA